jgi:plastocyanin
MALTMTMTVAATAVLWTGATPALAGGGCAHGTPPTDGSGTAVSMAENCFTPTVLHTDPGAEITFRNDDGVEHTVTGVGFLWGDTTDQQPGDEVTYRFDEDGVYLYACLIHPGMIGAIVVGDASGDAGLDPATVVAAPPADASGTQGATTAPVDASSGNAWMSAALAVAAGIAIGLLGFVVVRQVRRRRVATPA